MGKTFEEIITEATEKQLSGGEVEELIAKKVNEAITGAIEDSFRWGELKEAIKKRIQEVLVPQIESFDLDKYNIKLQKVLTAIVEESAVADTKTILENFSGLMTATTNKLITLEEIFEEYKKFVAEHVDCSGREVNTDGKPSYEYIGCSARIDDEDSAYWSSYERMKLQLEVEEEDQQDALNKTILLKKWKGSSQEGYEIEYDVEPTFENLRYMTDFDVFMCRLMRDHVRIITDGRREIDDEVEPDEKPEASWS